MVSDFEPIVRFAMKHYVRILISMVRLSFGLVMPLHGFAQGTFQWTVTFDGPPYIDPTHDIAITYYYEQGMTFRPIGTGQFGRSGGGIPQRPYNGTAFLVAAYTDSLSVTGTPSLFGLVSVDLAEYSTVVPYAVTVRFVGYRYNGSVIVTNFTTDGIIDGMGPLVDFETFYFSPEWSGLTRVEIPTYGWCLDNLRVFVPEPNIGSLLVLAAVMAALRFFKRRA